MLKILVICRFDCLINVKYIFYILNYIPGIKYYISRRSMLSLSYYCSFCDVKVAFLTVVAHLLDF